MFEIFWSSFVSSFKNTSISEILNSIKGVIIVDSVNDDDGTVCDAIRRHKPTYFANGGDRGKTNTPEQSVCDELGVKLLWGVGGDDKVDASSDLVNRFREHEKSLAAPVRTGINPSDK